MDLGANIIILVPIFIPLVRFIGIDMTHFGLITIVALAIGLITPPVAVCTIVAAQIGGVPIDQRLPRQLPSAGRHPGGAGADHVRARYGAFLAATLSCAESRARIAGSIDCRGTAEVTQGERHGNAGAPWRTMDRIVASAAAPGSWPQPSWAVQAGQPAAHPGPMRGATKTHGDQSGIDRIRQQPLLGWYADHGADRGGHDQRAVQVRELSELPIRRGTRSGRRRETRHDEADDDLDGPPVGLQPA